MEADAEENVKSTSLVQQDESENYDDVRNLISFCLFKSLSPTEKWIIFAFVLWIGTRWNSNWTIMGFDWNVSRKCTSCMWSGHRF